MQLIGYLPTNEAVYQHEKDNFAKEADYEFLVEMTDDELRTVLSERR